MTSRRWPPTVHGDWRGTHRLVLATYGDTSEHFLADLAPDGTDHDAGVAALAELAAATNTRLMAQADRSALALGTPELVFDLDHSQIVNAAFAYPGQGGRFHDTTRGAWYAGLELETSLAEVAFHKALALAEIDWWDEEADYQDYRCDIGGDHFADLRGGDRRTLACRDPSSYVASQQLAEQLLAEGAAGAVWPSVRHPDGTCVVCFRPALLPPISLGGRYRLRWDGPAQPSVTALT